MKQNGFWKGFGSGLVLTVLIAALCVTATATSKRSIQVEDGIGITLNGARFTPRDADGKQVSAFLYNGTTYVPVRAISEAMGMDVSFNSATRTVQLTTADRTASQQGASSASGNYISADRAKQIALNDAGVKEVVNAPPQLLLAAPLLFLPLQVQQDLQVVHNGPHEGGDLLLFTAGEETDVRVKLCVGTAHQDLSIRPFLRLQYLFQPGCQGVEGPGGAGRALG